MKVIIAYSSIHHQNTLKVITAIKNKYSEVELFDVDKNPSLDLSNYDLIGFASGVAFSKLYKSLVEFARNNLPLNKNCFIMYTCGLPTKDFTKELKNIIASKAGIVEGTFFCKGFDTFLPLKLIGGINKNHPTTEEINLAVEFFENLPSCINK